MSTYVEWSDRWKLSLPEHDQLWRLHQQLRREMKARWNRSLSFGDELFDRWEKAHFLGFGQGSSVYDNVMVLGNVTVGMNVWIGPQVVLDGSGGLSVGDNCTISAGVMIYSHDDIQRCLTGGKAAIDKQSVSIGCCTYLAPMTIVSRGVSIGSHTLIGAHSLVNTDIPDYAIAAGCPAKVIGRIELAEDGSIAQLIYD